MPPASRSATRVSRIASSRLVLPWASAAAPDADRGARPPADRFHRAAADTTAATACLDAADTDRSGAAACRAAACERVAMGGVADRPSAPACADTWDVAVLEFQA